jgi:hypothetical protein
MSIDWGKLSDSEFEQKEAELRGWTPKAQDVADKSATQNADEKTPDELSRSGAVVQPNDGRPDPSKDPKPVDWGALNDDEFAEREEQFRRDQRRAAMSRRS